MTLCMSECAYDFEELKNMCVHGCGICRHGMQSLWLSDSLCDSLDISEKDVHESLYLFKWTL